ncbi:MBOAT family O-acyltransferase [Flavobacterium sp. TBRC 19031]|uniref:MBOAT family O-acyltransferase n=1 Tax=Flavobacterium mekongense TaxID=3379707 RepID=UPI00399A36C2
MLFNSIHFAVFLPIVLTLYWMINPKKVNWQNILLLAASYFFYACWDWRFLFLLLFSTFLDFFTGIKMEKSATDSHKKIWFWISIVVNLGFLGVFKYYDFFAVSLSQSLSHVGIQANPLTLDIVLPVGISFYTFHGLSYVIDIYFNRIKSEKNFIDYALFVSFFPLLVAGPIERATHLLPQIKNERKFDYHQAVDGMRQILWGLFKKIVIADSCAVFANDIFQNYTDYSGSTLVLGALFFAFQIYGDFSGYSDIALGTAKLFGIDLLRNFAYPYFSRDIAEFWRRWHISLSSWFKDYLYIPLGGSKGGNWIKIRNTFIIFIVSGFWHGANWTFIFWGLLNAFFILPAVLLKTNRVNMDIVAQGRLFPNFNELLSIFITFLLTTFAWIFFRAENIGEAFAYVGKICSSSILSLPEFTGMSLSIYTFFFLVIMITIEWIGRDKQHGLQSLGIGWKKPLRWSMYTILVLSIYYFSSIGSNQEFIYFQF